MSTLALFAMLFVVVTLAVAVGWVLGQFLFVAVSMALEP